MKCKVLLSAVEGVVDDGVVLEGKWSRMVE